ncbi:MAG: PAS domain-containing sensor histidine kinase [Pyrinomonadaceae bacterium]|nr:PAS domain-containing sensor histidine kinase [Sphingobacteriaceae bacterium]
MKQTSGANHQLSELFTSHSVKDFLDNATVGIHSVDTNGKIIYANKAELKLLGYSSSEYLGKTISDFHADKNAIENIFTKLLDAEEVYEHPARLICKDGNIKNVLINSSGYFENGKLIHTRCFTRDITEQTKVKDALIESEINRQFMADFMPQQVWTATPLGALDYVNQRVLDNFQSSAEQIIGEGWIKFVHPDDRVACIEKWKYSLQTGESYQVEFRLEVLGEYRWYLGRATPLFIEGKLVKWFGTNTDIHDHKAEEERKDAFISIASHELKTPLTNIKAFVQLAKKNITESSPSSKFLAKADEHVANLQTLISDLLDVSKINAGAITYNFTEFNFADLLQESIDAIQANSLQHTILLESEVNINYTGDRFRIEQVISNILNNAIKYSPHADKVLVKSSIQDENIVVEIRDFGIGIHEDNLSKIFNRFYRVDNTAMKFQGLGLGLFICSEIIKRHRGSFWIESEIDEGSTFHFLLPMQEHSKNLEETNQSTYYKSSFIEIIYNKELHQLDVDWTGYQNLETVMAGGMQMLKMIQINKCSAILNDNTNVKGNWSEAADWAGGTWFPMMEREGLKYFAWIYSPSTFSALSAQKSVDVKVGNVVSQFFTSTGEAQQWLAGLK